MGSLRGTLDPESQLLFDEVTTKYLRSPIRRTSRSVSIDRRVEQRYAEYSFRAFVQGLGADKKALISDVMADPRFRLRAWQQVRQWDHDRVSGAWASREKEIRERYRPGVAAVRVFRGLAVLLVILGLMINDGGPFWAGLVVLAVAFCVEHFALPSGGLNYPVWRAHIDPMLNGRTKAAD
ncbi:hypothetical protein LR392_05795 [Arthrobacter sp. AK04]|nr:hypothetical protein [Arthrobacter sp. AK04]